MRYLEKLIEQCRVALMAKPKRIFEWSEKSDIKDVGAAVYVIEEIGGDPETTFTNFREYREEQSKKNESERRACAALNEPSKVLYVGSSTTGIRNRIQGHLGNGPKGTYALQLKHWFIGQYKIVIRDYGEIDREIIQLIEDDLADSLKPSFGKRGGNGR